MYTWSHHTARSISPSTQGVKLAPIISMAGYYVCIVAGQMVFSVLLDVYGLFGYPVRGLQLLKLVGTVLVFVGAVVVQVRRHNTSSIIHPKSITHQPSHINHHTSTITHPEHRSSATRRACVWVLHCGWLCCPVPSPSHTSPSPHQKSSQSALSLSVVHQP